MPGRILLLGTFDTKGPEYSFLRDRILEAGCEVVLVNAGIDGMTDLFPVDVEAGEVAQAGGESIDELRRDRDRGRAIAVMSAGAAVVVRRLFEEGRFDGIIGMGGSGGTGIVTSAIEPIQSLDYLDAGRTDIDD